MQRVLIVISATMMMLLLLFITMAVAQPTEDNAEVQEVTGNFLRAHMVRDLPTLRKCIPNDPSHFFGPYPFKEPPTVAQPKVKNNQAIIEFTGNVADGKYPPKGAILFRREKGTWLVRQVLFYDKVPSLMRLPKKSVTDKDKAYEPTVKKVGATFMEAWRTGDVKTMRANWFDWTAGTDDQRDGLSMSDLKITTTKTAWNDYYAKYTAKMTYRWGPLGYTATVHGAVILAKENGKWRVRPLQMIFDF
ncbi:MAG: hypothetical protein ACYDBB_13255 [Armatimonadota bacterium]